MTTLYRRQLYLPFRDYEFGCWPWGPRDVLYLHGLIFFRHLFIWRLLSDWDDGNQNADMSTAAVTQEAINIKDDINSMIATIAGMQQQEWKQQHCYNCTTCTEETPTTELAIAGTPTTVWLPSAQNFGGKFAKNFSESQKIHKKSH